MFTDFERKSKHFPAYASNIGLLTNAGMCTGTGLSMGKAWIPAVTQKTNYWGLNKVLQGELLQARQDQPAWSGEWRCRLCLVLVPIST